MIINHNLMANNALRNMNINSNSASKSMQKLSSGLRINGAADDAAGLSISEKMRGQIRGLDQASSNAQDGISMIQTAEGALNETTSILQRMRELATQAANDTNVSVDRDSIQKEINQLSSEINRIGNTTEFNTQKVLNGGGNEKVQSVGTITRGGALGATGAFSTIATGVSEVQGGYTVSLSASITAGSVITIGGQSFTAVSGNADASQGQFDISSGSTATMASSLANAVNANEALHTRFADVTVASDVLTFTERTGEATGVALTASGTGVTTAEATASTKEVLGKVTFEVADAFEVVGQIITISGVDLTAVSSNATGANFDISSDKRQSALNVAAAINGSALSDRFTASVDDKNVITLTEKVGHGSNAQPSSSDIVLSGTSAAVAGQYTTTANELVQVGGKFTLDGVDISVTNDPNDSGLSNGTAILASDDLTTQTSRLANAINSNGQLNAKYTATSTGSKLTLTQKSGEESLDAPELITNTTTKSAFEATLQVGANVAQSMTISVSDMRSNALHITSKDADTTTVTAKDGSVASYVTNTNVTNGTTNTNVEYSLDVSNHDKATAAISVINDAIEAVSAQRSQLGAFQNRLEHTIANLGTSSENLTSAESRIRDVDMAKEMSIYSKNNILSQAAQAMLAQANQQPQQVLQLLR